jgi:carbonic anhydrase
MTQKEKIFLESKAWAMEKLSLDKTYFKRLAGLHTPDILWIGSIDSLVPVRELINADPGEILVYRNLGCQVRKDDLSLMATIQDAVEVSNVEYIVVCGYSHCSGIQDVISGNDNRPFVQKWLEELRVLSDSYSDELNRLDLEQRSKRLAELNIKAQIIKLSQLDAIRNAWETKDHPILFGWYFDLDTGALTEVFSMEADSRLRQVTSLLQTS